MLNYATCERLWDAIPAFREHVPASGDWIFFVGDDRSTPARPCLIDTDGSALIQRDDGEPGVLHRDVPEGEVLRPFCWCPRLDQLLALWPEDENLSLGRGITCGWFAHGSDVWEEFVEGETPEDAVAAWLLRRAAQEADHAPKL